MTQDEKLEEVFKEVKSLRRLVRTLIDKVTPAEPKEDEWIELRLLMLRAGLSYHTLYSRAMRLPNAMEKRGGKVLINLTKYTKTFGTLC